MEKIDAKILAKAKAELDQEAAMLREVVEKECGPLGWMAFMEMLKVRVNAASDKKDFMEMLVLRLAAHGMSQVVTSIVEGKGD